MYKIDAIVFEGEKDWTKVLDGYEIIFLEVTGFDRFEDIPADCDKTMKYCMKKFLKPKERKVLHLRYFGKLSYKDIADRLDLSQERVRQINMHAIRILRTPMCNKILRYGMEYHDKMMALRRIQSEQIASEKIDQLEDQIINAMDNNDLERLIEFKKEIQSFLNKKYGAGAIECYEKDMPINVLELSVRSYNCLKRANYNTLGDLEGKSHSDLMRIRNFGVGSLNEVVQACKAHGINIVDE